MRGVKIRAILKKWGYINNDLCSFCNCSETLEHCFFLRNWLEEVWKYFHPLLLKLSSLSLSFENLIFLTESLSDPKAVIVSFIVKTILYEILISRYQATFRTKHDTSNTIIQNVKHEISFRIKHKFDHLRLAPFKKLWAVNNCLSKIFDDRLLIINVWYIL